MSSDEDIQLTPRQLELREQLLSTQRTHIKHKFSDSTDSGNYSCRFVCQSYWATQFQVENNVHDIFLHFL